MTGVNESAREGLMGGVDATMTISEQGSRKKPKVIHSTTPVSDFRWWPICVFAAGGAVRGSAWMPEDRPVAITTVAADVTCPDCIAWLRA